MTESHHVQKANLSGVPAAARLRWLGQLRERGRVFFLDDAAPPARFIATGLCALCALTAFILAWAAAAAWAAAFAVLAYLFGGGRTAFQAVSALRQGRPDIHFLMILAAIVSAMLGHWDEGAILLFLFSLSDALECYALERTHRGIRALLDLRPPTACRVRDGVETTLPVEDLRVGDEIRVRPGERFPIDGQVLDGRSAVDESIVTGEPIPVDKSPGDALFAGSINANGSLLVRVAKPASESTIARIVRMVEEAQATKPAAQRLIEKWQTPYVLGVLGISSFTVLAYLIGGATVAGAVKTGMVLLVAASPCAVVLATPVAVLAAVTRGARYGVLFKGGAHIERLATVAAIAFDKTGTITRGKPAVVAVVPGLGHSEEQVLAVAAGLESRSEHPLARAIVAEAARRGLLPPPVDDFRNQPGLGVAGYIGRNWTGAGRPELFAQRGLAVAAELLARAQSTDGETNVIVAQADGPQGVITLADTLRPEAPAAFAALREIGIEQLLMLTGDQSGPAAQVARQLDIRDFKAALRPEDKLAEIHALATTSGVAMVGDGVNDAPALAAASVGIAMGAAGSDVALETADVVLMRDDLRSLAEAVHLARRCRRVIQQSLLIAMGMIAMLVGLTLAGSGMPLTAAVVGHEGSTVLVVLNGLRLLRERPLSAAASGGPVPGTPAAA